MAGTRNSASQVTERIGPGFDLPRIETVGVHQVTGDNQISLHQRKAGTRKILPLQHPGGRLPRLS
jgi:hypothetical protein